MKLESVFSGGCDSPMAIGLLHAMHLGTLMLLNHAVLATVLKGAGNQLSAGELSHAALESYGAAQQNARLFNIMMTEGGIFQKCWLAM